MKSARLPLTLLFAGALAIAVAAPQPLALAAETPFQLPDVLYAALIGALSTLIISGLKDRFPAIANALAILISAVVVTALDFLAGVITTGVPVEFWPLLYQGALLLASWLAAWGTYRAAKGIQYALAGSVRIPGRYRRKAR